MNKLIGAFIAGVMLLVPAAAGAAERGSATEAKVLVEKAVAKIAADGPKAAFAAFESRDGGFVDRDLYIFVSISTARSVARRQQGPHRPELHRPADQGRRRQGVRRRIRRGGED